MMAIQRKMQNEVETGVICCLIDKYIKPCIRVYEYGYVYADIYIYAYILPRSQYTT